MATHYASGERSYETAAEATAVVLRGPFTPSTFSPSWFRLLDLIGDREIKDSEVFIISEEVSQFRMGWIDFQATKDALQFSTTDADELPRIRDIAMGTLSILTYQPVAALGINRTSHTPLPSMEMLHQVGDTLAPKAPWQGVTTSPGLRTVTIWDVRTDGWQGNVAITVEPSNMIEQAVYVAINDHFDLELDKTADLNRDFAFNRDRNVEPSLERRQAALAVLESEWDASMRRAAAVRNSVMETAT